MFDIKTSAYQFEIWLNLASQIETGMLMDLFCEMCVLT